jgi:hypothetical protein
VSLDDTQHTEGEAGATLLPPELCCVAHFAAAVGFPGGHRQQPLLPFFYWAYKNGEMKIIVI